MVPVLTVLSKKISVGNQIEIDDSLHVHTYIHVLLSLSTLADQLTKTSDNANRDKQASEPLPISLSVVNPLE